jgi:sugar O-acyltransferase (sialic acid O-acetyltransferase NeuD family)
MSHASSRLLPLVMIGAGGHAKVVLALARALGRDVVGVCDPVLTSEGASHWRDIPVFGDDAALAAVSPQEVELANGIGQVPRGPHTRQRLHDFYTARGFRFPALVHPSAIVDPSVTVEVGAQIMAGAVLQADVVVGESSIVNTGAQVDHDCVIGRHVHIAPGTVLCGGVTVGDHAFLGAACTVLPLIAIGAHGLVAAGTVLARRLDVGEPFWPHRDDTAAKRTQGGGENT